MGYEKTAMLTHYRRHTEKCFVHKLKLTPAAKRKYMDCDCPLWIYGNTETTHVPRQSTGTNIIAVAEAQRQAFLRTGNQRSTSRASMIAWIAYTYGATGSVHFMRELSVDLPGDFKVEELAENMAATRRTEGVAGPPNASGGPPPMLI